MAIIITNDGDKIVGTIADRDAITRKFDGMNVRVEDSIADVNTGGGEAVYQWNETQSRWMLTWKENKDNLTFITEIMQISNGQVTASHVPQNSLVWDCTIQSTINGADIIMYDVRPDVSGYTISLGTTDHDGEYLVFTYGYGIIQAAVTAILSANAGVGLVSQADLALKADQATTYTKTEVDSAVSVKANSADVYTKTEVDSAVSVKANSADVYTKTASDAALALKADQATTFTKTETTAAIQAVVGAAPAALDTLKEIADQLATEQTAAAALTNVVSTKAPLASPTFTGTVSGITATMVGLGNVDNTADTAKPVSTAQQTAIDAKGYMNVPQVSQSANYTLVASDSGKHILHPSADTTARTFTIPANASVAYAIGTVLTFINQNGGGNITIAITSDTMRLAGAGTTGSRTLAANGIAVATKVTATEWLISGVNLT